MCLSIVLAWIGAPVSLKTLSALDASSSVTMTTGPYHVATLSSTTKAQRPAEFRHGLDPHTVNLSAETLHVAEGVGPTLNVRTVVAPTISLEGAIAQPRAPPLT